MWHKRRPVRAEADFLEFKNIVKLEIKMDKSKCMNLLFDPGHDMEERIINEQFKRDYKNLQYLLGYSHIKDNKLSKEHKCCLV